MRQDLCYDQSQARLNFSILEQRQQAELVRSANQLRSLLTVFTPRERYRFFQCLGPFLATYRTVSRQVYLNCEFIDLFYQLEEKKGRFLDNLDEIQAIRQRLNELLPLPEDQRLGFYTNAECLFHLCAKRGLGTREYYYSPRYQLFELALSLYDANQRAERLRRDIDYTVGCMAKLRAVP